MIDPKTDGRHGRIPFTLQELGLARYTNGGAFRAGRGVEFDALRTMGERDASLGRLYEGHFNGALLVALYGTPEQRGHADAATYRGELFGVWNTQDADRVTIERTGSRFILHGAKTWASGADSVTRALITAAMPDGQLQMCLVPMDRAHAQVDPSAWRPLGMHGSNSFRVSFEGVTLDETDLIGKPGDYERPPWFLAGAVRFAAVHVGIIERIVRETLDLVIARGRQGDPLVRSRIADLELARVGARAWLDRAERTWTAFDRGSTPATIRDVLDVGDLVRTAVERAALETLELAIRTVGAHGMIEPLPFAALFRDLHMYLRQPAPDMAILRIADSAIAARIDAASRP